MLALTSQGCLAHAGCECSVISCVLVQLHKPSGAQPYTNTWAQLAIPCWQAKDASALTLSEHTSKAACVEMGEGGRKKLVEGNALLCRLSAQQNGGMFLHGFSLAHVTSYLGGFFLHLAGSQDYN